jgi:tetratricopeptide (TPR) repeat protein
MNRTIITGLLLTAAGLSSLAAQQQPAQSKPPASGQPAPAQPAQPKPAAQPKGPAPKSQKELQALQALFGAKDPDSVIKASDALIVGFADTDFKDIALLMAADSYQRKGDPEKAIIYAERALEANKNNFQAMLMLAEILSQRTREHDFDREEKLGRAEKYANGAIAALKTAQKPNPQITDDQWEQNKKYLTAQAHQSIGMAAMTRKKYDVAISELKMAVDGVGAQEPAFQVRLAQAYALAGKNDEAIAVCTTVLAAPNLHPQIKQVAEALKDGATKAKASGAPKPAAGGPQQVEIKP